MDKFARAAANGEVINIPADGVGKAVETLTASVSLTAADSGKVFLVATDALVISLPETVSGFEATFINTGAAGNNIITVSPVAADGIAGTITLAATVVTRVGTVNVDVVNTKATSTLGNTLKIAGTGTTGTGAWIITGSTGIWA